MMRGSMYISDDKHSIHPQRAHIRLSNTKRKGGRKASTYMLFSPYPYPYNSSNSTLWKEYSLSTIWWCGVLKPLSYYDYDNDNGMENQIVTLQIEPSHNSYANSMRWWLGPENQKGVKQYIRVMHWYILFWWECGAKEKRIMRGTRIVIRGETYDMLIMSIIIRRCAWVKTHPQAAGGCFAGVLLLYLCKAHIPLSPLCTIVWFFCLLSYYHDDEG